VFHEENDGGGILGAHLGFNSDADATGGARRRQFEPIVGSASHNILCPLLTDMYQITMCYAYFNAGRHRKHAVFDLFFRKNPFQGEYTIFAGLEDCLKFIEDYKFTEEHLDFLRAQMPTAKEEFLEYLRQLDCSEVKIYAMKEGSVCFPRQPLLRVEGPVGICQLLETTLLCLINFASLVATNAARMRAAVGPNKTLLEFGLRRSQGPDGGLSASKYSYIGGFDGTSSALAGLKFGMKVGGTHAHSFVQSFSSLDDLESTFIESPTGGAPVDILVIVQKYRKELNWGHTNNGELAAFIGYSQAFPTAFLALVDTYDTLVSGIPNFLLCALAMYEIGFKPLGIRLDSGDLAYLSLEARNMFKQIEDRFNIPGMAAQLKIVASNDIGEDTLYSLAQQGHSIDTFGIGTHISTCQTQPALGCVYKLVEFDGNPRIKLSQEIRKVSVPGKKIIYRLIGRAGFPLVDLMILDSESPDNEPRAGERVMCRHPLDPTKRVVCIPHKVQALLSVVWDTKRSHPPNSITSIRAVAMKELSLLRHDHVRYLNPTPYKVSLSEHLFTTMHDLWRVEAPIAELS